MGKFSDMLARDSAIWVDAGEADAEDVIYTPRVGAARPISAQVHREIPETDETQQGATVSAIRVLVRNSLTVGVSAAEVNTGGDTLVLAERLGQTPRALPIIEVISQDAGMLYLRVAPSR